MITLTIVITINIYLNVNKYSQETFILKACKRKEAKSLKDYVIITLIMGVNFIVLYYIYFDILLLII